MSTGQLDIDTVAALAPGEATREQRVAASRFVLRHARSLADLRALCNAIGLNNPPREEAPRV
ncbi:hypothetical protein [Streptomyces alboflavus]|uniref:hypothetical protein n=1 Tax=Streptomyces alboflavus TaxID=67267 RepID=UPI0004BF9AF6|nr:hypothetical protein [Streptomyces alboflavus]